MAKTPSGALDTSVHYCSEYGKSPCVTQESCGPIVDCRAADRGANRAAAGVSGEQEIFLVAQWNGLVWSISERRKCCGVACYRDGNCGRPGRHSLLASAGRCRNRIGLGD